MPLKNTLAQRIAQRIAQQALSERWPPAFHLVKNNLANQFGVSRTPVQQALELLEHAGLARQDLNRGYFLTASVDALSHYLAQYDAATQQSDTQRIIFDRLAGRLIEIPTEQEMLRLYGWNKARLNAALRELASGGIIERMPGYGWQFQPLVTGLATQRFSYDFRRTIECAALTSPDYRVDEALFKDLREEQCWLLEGGLEKVTHAEMFEIGSRYHERLVSCSGNPFYLDALRRANRLRSFYERSVPIAPTSFQAHCAEHIEIIDTLLRGEQQQGVKLLNAHLGNVQQMKMISGHEHMAGNTNGQENLMIHF